MGDFNTKVGKEKYQKKAVGNYSVHNIIHENGNVLG
jgi:hypothetical protein